jgi:Leucine-rich repeat (LRR) protein
MVKLPNLQKANFNNNAIVTLEDFDGHNKIQVIELRGNKLKSLKGLKKLLRLKELYIAENQI